MIVTLLLILALVMALTCERWRNPLWTLSIAVALIAGVLLVSRIDALTRWLK